MIGKSVMLGSILFGGLFVVSGLGMLFVAANTDWVRTLDSGATCAAGRNCGSARTTLVMVGGSFVAAGLFSAVVPVVVARWVRRWTTRLTTPGPPLSAASAERLRALLTPLGVDLATAASAEPVAGAPAAGGSHGTAERLSATILQKTDRGPVAGGQRLLEFELEVRPPVEPPYRVTVASLVRESLAGLLIEGSSLAVRAEQGNPEQVTIDWSEN